jgi:Transcriptional regulator, AbiEi antitoxin
MRNFHKLARLAQRQAGVVSRPQALALGIKPTALRRAVAGKLLVRHLRGVYRLAGARIDRALEHWAVLLWAGDGAALSHLTAGRLWRLDGLGQAPPLEISISVPASRQLVSLPRVRVYRVQSLVQGRDYATLYGLPVTSLARTLFDLAGVLTDESLEQAFDSAARKDPAVPAAVLELIARLGTAGRLGAGSLAAIAQRDELGPTGSPLEVRVRRALRKAGISIPVPQLAINDLRDGTQIGVFDFAWPERGVVLFADGYATHSPHDAFEKDRQQLSALAANGWSTLLVTSRRLDRDCEGFIRVLRRALDRGHPIAL